MSAPTIGLFNFRKERVEKMKPYKSVLSVLAIAGLMLLTAACSQEPAEIYYRSDECVHCKMMIMDNQFAAQLVTTTGKAYKFDAIECLAAYYNDNSTELKNAVLYVSDYDRPGSWLNARETQFVKSEVVQSPMGESLLAFSSSQEAKKHTAEKPGKILQWDDVLELKK